MIECGEWRADSNPYQNQATHKRSEPPAGDQVWEGTSKSIPTAQVNPRYDHQRRCDREQKYPPQNLGIELGHSHVYRGETSLSPSVTPSEALRAGFRFVGCRVSRNAT